MAYNVLRSIRMGDTMIVAVKGGVDWAAYQGSIGGRSSEYYEQGVAAHGAKLPVDVARIWFKELEGVPYRY